MSQLSHSNVLEDKDTYKPSTDISKDDENFLKEFSIDFYRKIIDINDLNIFEDLLIEWMKNTGKDTESIFGLMQNHEQTEFWFSSIIGFFYQHGISCDTDKNKALELYLLSIKDEKEFLIKNFVEENDILQNLNVIIGEYLFSLFCYKDIILDILDKRNLNYSDVRRSTNPLKAVLQKLQNPFKNLKNSSRDNTENDIKSDSNLVVKNDLEDYNKQIKKLETTDQKIFKMYLKSAEDGFPIAQWNLGRCYYYGRGVSQDYKEAFEWYSKSANNGYPKSQSDLGKLYYYGRGVNQDYKKAFEWYSKSANNECPKGQYGLGLCYENGFGIGKDHSKAFEWYEKSADNGCAEAQSSVGTYYYFGIGVRQNHKRAFSWYSTSAKNGCGEGQNNLGFCYTKGIGTNIDDNKAFEWYLKSSNNGNSKGYHNLGKCYHCGKGTEKDIEKAVIWYKKASDNGIATIELQSVTAYSE